MGAMLKSTILLFCLATIVNCMTEHEPIEVTQQSTQSPPSTSVAVQITSTNPLTTTKQQFTTTTNTADTAVTVIDSVNITDVIDKALHYLMSKRQPDYGWGNDTHKVILALQLANSSSKEVEHHSLEMQLSAKQMEIEILLMMSKHHESPPPLERLASYTLALGSLCKDPRSFHGRDLVTTLLHREPPHDLDFAYATLAACSSAAHVRRKHIRRLLDIGNAAADHNLDTIAMVILALRCIVQDHRHRNLLHFVRRPMAGLARQQQADGGFGGVFTTALAIQALEEPESGSNGHHWNSSAARAWLANSAEADGGWGDVPLTASAVIALVPAHLSSLTSVRTPRCPDKLFDSRHDANDNNGGDGSTLKLTYLPGNLSNDSESRNVSFTYTLWVGSNVTENYTLYMVAPRNTSFFHVMQMAAETDPKFEFSASEWPNGHYVHTLSGHKEEPMGYNYWLLYRLTEVPDPSSPPGNQLVAPVGVDDLPVEDGEHYLFWYKKL